MPTARHRRLIGCLCFAVALLGAAALAGCGNSAQRLTALRSALDQGQTASAALDAQLTELRPLIAEAAGQLSTAEGEQAQRIAAVLADANARLDGLTARKAQADAAVRDWRSELDRLAAQPQPTWATEVDALAAGARAAAGVLPSPINWIVTLLAGVASVVAGVERWRARRATTALEEVVTGADLAITEAGGAASGVGPATIKRQLRAAQSATTRALVDRLRATA